MRTDDVAAPMRSPIENGSLSIFCSIAVTAVRMNSCWRSMRPRSARWSSTQSPSIHSS